MDTPTDGLSKRERFLRKHHGETMTCWGCSCEYPLFELSHRGLCFECGANHMQESARQLHDKKGPYFERWLASVEETRADRFDIRRDPNATTRDRRPKTTPLPS